MNADRSDEGLVFQAPAEIYSIHIVLQISELKWEERVKEVDIFGQRNMLLQTCWYVVPIEDFRVPRRYRQVYHAAV